jgi:hypothetical protein
MIDINKYKNKRFSKDSFVDKRIKALFLFYDKKVSDSNLGFDDSIKLLNHMISVFVATEEYELAEAFKQRKIHKFKKRRNKNLNSIVIFYRFCKSKLKQFKSKLFR